MVTPKAAEPRRIICSTSIVADLVRQVAGPDLEVAALAQAGSDPHVFEPTPKDAAHLSDADLALGLGLDYDLWFDKLCRSARGQVPGHIAAGELLAAAGHAHAAGGCPHCQHGRYDPHLWLSPVNAAAMLERIGQLLAAADPARAQAYTERAAAAAARMLELKKRLGIQLATLPREQRTLGCDHRNLAYFCRDFELNCAATLLPSLTTEDADPSAKDLAVAVEALREHKVRLILVSSGRLENLAHTAAAEVVRQGGTKPHVLLMDLESLAAPGSASPQTVQELIESLAAAIVAKTAAP